MYDEITKYEMVKLAHVYEDDEDDVLLANTKSKHCGKGHEELFQLYDNMHLCRTLNISSVLTGDRSGSLF